VGWVLATVRPAPAQAGPGDRPVRGDNTGGSIITTGPVFVSYDEAVKAAIPLEALYILDYKTGRLLATIPTYRQTNKSTEIVEHFVERDLVDDFKLDLQAGPAPRFLMTTGSLGPYTSGWAPLYVVETSSKQVGVYRIHMQQSSAKSSRPRFELVEMRSYAGQPAPEPIP
jgi:hypothetical protein